ncbi:class I SAM-dependent methyltransferase [Streptomyces sp. NPDC058861]|uniref:class I SAM-dependent methyltransferase n=1 Tax=Streptomyces sp. NPDC058861 TaxID=3346653 RepID=UPI00369F53BF
MSSNTAWKDAGDVADGYDSYDDLPERLIGYPAVFHALGIGSSAVRTVLDHGCGPGKVAVRVVEASGARVVAADVSPHMLAVARERHPHPRVDHRLIEDDGRLAFLDDGSVDAAMSCFVYVTVGEIEGLHDIAAEVHRVLRPGGRYAVLDTNPRSTGVRFSTFRTGDPGRVYTKGELRPTLLERPGGAPLELADHHWPCQTYLDVLGKAGFTDLDVHEPVLPRHSSLLGSRPAEADHPPFLVVSGVKG